VAASGHTKPGTAGDLVGSGDARGGANQADSLAMRLAMADLRLAAWFLWMTPLLAALSS
jgi:hypothetical protein